MSSSQIQLSDEELSKPLWKYVTKYYKSDGGAGGGNTQWQCNFCMKVHKSSYTRVKAHLLKIKSARIGVCLKVTSTNLSEMQKLDREAKDKIRNTKVPLPPSTSSFTLSETQIEIVKKRKMSTSVGGKLEKAFNIQCKEQLDAEIARMFYLGGLSFHLARNPYYRSFYTFAANHSLLGYVPPSYNDLRTTLLQKENANVNRLLSPTKEMGSLKGVSIVSDGWSDAQRRPLINFIVVSDGQGMFLKAVDCLRITKDKFFIANLMKEVINEIEHEKVVQVVNDNAANCKCACQIIEGLYPTIFSTPRVVHTLNLALKNICAAKNTENN